MPDDNKEPNPEPEPEPEPEPDIDEEISNLIDTIERLTAENATIISRLAECESAITTLREHKHEPEPEPEPEPLPEPEPIPEERHLWYRTIGGRKA